MIQLPYLRLVVDYIESEKVRWCVRHEFRRNEAHHFLSNLFSVLGKPDSTDHCMTLICASLFSFLALLKDWNALL
jgi:hypothetical protein